MHTQGQVLVLDQIMPAALQWMLLILPQQELIDQQRMQTQRFQTWRGISSALGCHSCCTRLNQKRTHQIGSGTDDVPARGGIIEPSLLEALSVTIKAATARLLDGLVHESPASRRSCFRTWMRIRCLDLCTTRLLAFCLYFWLAGISRRLYAFPACFLGPKDFSFDDYCFNEYPLFGKRRTLHSPEGERVSRNS